MTRKSAIYKEILVPLDGSELAEAALIPARELASAFGARVTLLTVVPVPIRPSLIWAYDGYGGGAPVGSETVAEIDEVIEREQAEETAKATNYLCETGDKLKAEGISAREQVVKGDPASVICDIARDIPADMIVMSTHGRSGIQRWVHGSVADRVLRDAEVPILLIHPHTQGDRT